MEEEKTWRVEEEQTWGMEKEEIALHFSHELHYSLSLLFTHFCHESTSLSRALSLTNMVNVEIV